MKVFGFSWPLLTSSTWPWRRGQANKALFSHRSSPQFFQDAEIVMASCHKKDHYFTLFYLVSWYVCSFRFGTSAEFRHVVFSLFFFLFSTHIWFLAFCQLLLVVGFPIPESETRWWDNFCMLEILGFLVKIFQFITELPCAFMSDSLYYILDCIYLEHYCLLPNNYV